MTNKYFSLQLENKIDLIKSLIQVDGDITFRGTLYKDKEVAFGGYTNEEHKTFQYVLTEAHIEMLEETITIDEIRDVYEAMGFFKEV